MRYSVSVKLKRDFVKIDEETKSIEIGVRSRPEKGKANEEIVKRLARYFHVPSSKVSIVSGLKSKSKAVEIDI